MASLAKPLKTANAPSIWGVLIADAVIVLLVQSGEGLFSTSGTTLAVRAVAAVLAPAVALLLGNVLPAGAKDVLVFWRFVDVLPGHRAKSLAAKDPRIDMARLEKNVSMPFPESPREQNAFWYRLYKKVEAEPNVGQCNRAFLLLRELAAISLVATIAAGLLCMVPAARPIGAIAAVLFGVQYIIAALGAGTNGKRLVTTVLAAHSAKRRP